MLRSHNVLKGHVVVNRQSTSRQFCPVCRGTGHVEHSHHCPACGGQGEITPRTLNGHWNPYLLFKNSEVNEAFLSAAVELCDGDFGTLQLFDSANRALRIVAQRGFKTEFLRFFESVKHQNSACGSAIKTKHHILVPDVGNDPIFKDSESGKVLLRARVSSVQSMPLAGPSGQVLGVVSTHYRKLRVPPGFHGHEFQQLTWRYTSLIEQQLQQ